jgi:hypothetical protein
MVIVRVVPLMTGAVAVNIKVAVLELIGIELGLLNDPPVIA